MNKRIDAIFYLDNRPVTIHVQDGIIGKIDRHGPTGKATGKKLYVAPGFIDHQVNGYLSHDFSRKGLTVDQVRKVTEAFWQFGITTYLPTLITSPRTVLTENFTILNKAIHDVDIGNSVPGFHLEGPYISPLDGFCGAHNKEWVRKPDWGEFLGWYEASGKNIMEVSLAPEIDGALELIPKLCEKGIVVALAHHNANTEIIAKAIDAGATGATHLGNGCANQIHRRNNPLWPQLADDRLTASLIVDGFHLTPAQVNVFTRTKGIENIVLVSDLSSLAGLPSGEYEWLGKRVQVHPDGKITMPSQNVFAAASSLIHQAVGNLLSITGCSLGDAIHTASRNPARFLGLDDRGEIKEGMRADLILFTVNDCKVEVKKTFVTGKLVYSS